MTELIWQGKYDENGKRTAPLRVSLPFQTVETINESTIERQRMLDLFSAGRDSDWRNRLIWGDKKYVLPSLLDEFAGKVNLIYIDPPFNVGADFSFTATLPDHPDTDEDETDTFIKEPSAIEMKAYRDTWGRGMDSYLQWFYETALILKELLSINGSIYVHCDSGINTYIRAIMDEVFGSESMRNEIVWRRANAHNDPNRCGVITDTIYYYSFGDKPTWNQLYTPYSQEYINSHWRSTDSNGRRYRLIPLDAPLHGDGGNLVYEWKGKWPAKSRSWVTTRDKMEDLDKQGKIVYTSKGTPNLKRYIDEAPGLPLQNLWDDIPPVNPMALERANYPTQKPEALLERIIKASSNENDLVLDCFCGSGTTAATAEKLNRRWITCDLGRFSIHTTRKRLLRIEGIKPFVVQNLGKYERQAWLETQFTQKEAHQKYREFILDLYHARPLNQHTWLHGIKGGRMVHIGSVDAPVTVGDLANIATEFKKTIGTGKDAPKSNGVDILGWDFAFELNEVAKQQAAQANLDVRFYRVPRDVMDKRAVEQGDIRFFELAALKVETKVSKKKEVTLTLTDFVIPPDDVPEDVQKAIKHWSQWVDYWAVDWDFKGDTFHNQWQTYRTRKNPDLQKSASHVYEQTGEYTVVVKVIDILGNDTTKTLKVKVG